MVADIGRREFLQRAGVAAAAAGALLGGAAAAEAESSAGSAPVAVAAKLPGRRLGRLGIEMPVLGFGSAPMGHALYEAGPFEAVLDAALDAGVRYVDTSPIYDVAETRLAPLLARRRQEVFLVTKTWAKSRAAALQSLEASLRRLQVDTVDLCHIHNVGSYSRDEAIGPDGCLAGLREAKQRGWIRHIGCSGHSNVANFVPVIETGEIDLVMVAMNFVDAHTYPFQEIVLPVARKHDCAIACMKVYGGVINLWEGYRRAEPGRLAGEEFRQDAVDYALSIPGVSLAVIGMKSLDELRLTLAAVRGHTAVDGARRERLLAKGRELAAQWGPRYGPV
jgi:aryl-alcohol dehydrogenase-like predicted oxidoreductase